MGGAGHRLRLDGYSADTPELNTAYLEGSYLTLS